MNNFYQPNKVTSGRSIPNGQGTYQGLYDADPYLGAVYQPSPWQSLLSNLGFRTGADAWRENMAVQSAEYQAQLAMKQYDEEYNLPINQISRMRAAGLNPDLNGGQGISSGEAQQPGQDPSVPMQSQGDEGIIMQVANGVMSAFSSALGMVSTLQGIHGTKLQNSLLAIEGESAFNSFVEEAAGLLLPASPNPDGIQNFDWRSSAMNNAQLFAGRLPKSMQSKFLGSIEQYWKSAIGESESYEDFRKRISSRRGYEFDSRYFWSEIDDVLTQIVEPLADMQEKIAKQNQSTELAESSAAESQADYEGELVEGLNPSIAAAAENASNQNTFNQQSSLSIVTGTIQDIMSNLKSASKKKGIEGALSSIALALISGLYLYVQSGARVSTASYSKQGRNSVARGSSFSLGF